VRELEEQNLALKDQLRMAQAEITQLHTQLAGVRTQKHQAIRNTSVPRSLICLVVFAHLSQTLTVAVLRIRDVYFGSRILGSRV
jgi:hypothetical protein